jgi:hypothetical protein
MNENRTDVEQLVERITRLEKQNWFWKWGGLLAIVMLAFSLTAGLRAQEIQAQLPYRARTVEAQRFVLKSGNGKVLGEWSATPGGGALVLYSPDGKLIWSSMPRIQE